MGLEKAKAAIKKFLDVTGQEASLNRMEKIARDGIGAEKFFASISQEASLEKMEKLVNSGPSWVDAMNENEEAEKNESAADVTEDK